MGSFSLVKLAPIRDYNHHWTFVAINSGPLLLQSTPYWTITYCNTPKGTPAGKRAIRLPILLGLSTEKAFYNSSTSLHTRKLTDPDFFIMKVFAKRLPRILRDGCYVNLWQELL